MPLPPVPRGPPSQMEPPPLPVLPLLPEPAVLDVPLAEEEVDFCCGLSEEQLACANTTAAASQKLVE